MGKLPLEALDPHLLLLYVVGEAALVLVEAVILDLDDPVADRLQKLAVVGDDDERTIELLKPAFQPAQAGDVEVVGRLVHQQNLGLLQDHFGERRTISPTAGKPTDRQLPVLG